jgi:hypothetical protein
MIPFKQNLAILPCAMSLFAGLLETQAPEASREMLDSDLFYGQPQDFMGKWRLLGKAP